MKYPIEIVTWWDASTEHGWKSLSEIDDDDPVITSIGFVVKETANNITLAMSVDDDDDDTNGRGRIPKPMIKSRTIITPPP